jgi:hypothetical protein
MTRDEQIFRGLVSYVWPLADAEDRQILDRCGDGDSMSSWLLIELAGYAHRGDLASTVVKFGTSFPEAIAEIAGIVAASSRLSAGYDDNAAIAAHDATVRRCKSMPPADVLRELNWSEGRIRGELPIAMAAHAAWWDAKTAAESEEIP